MDTKPLKDDLVLYESDAHAENELYLTWKGKHFRNWFRWLFQVREKRWIVIDDKVNERLSICHLHMYVDRVDGLIPSIVVDSFYMSRFGPTPKTMQRCDSPYCWERVPETLYKKVVLINGE